MKSSSRLNWEFIGRTETIRDNLNPNFLNTFVLNYIFEVRQDLRFEIFDDDGKKADALGFVETTLSSIVGARNNTLILDINKGSGKLALVWDKVADCNDDIVV